MATTKDNAVKTNVAMGVSVSKARPVIKSKCSDDLTLVESFETFSEIKSEDSLSTLSSCSIEIADEKSDSNGKSTGTDVALDGGQLDTCRTSSVSLHGINTQNAFGCATSRAMPQHKFTCKTDSCQDPVSDAEKRLRMYENEMKSSTPQNENTGNPTNDYYNATATASNATKTSLVLTKKTKSHILMKNDDILKVRRKGVFTAEMIQGNPVQNLNPVPLKKPGQNDILFQLGKEGIVRQMTEEEKTIGELRNIGIIKQNSEESSSKRVVPRLAPLKVESLWEKVPGTELKAPWERKDPLRPPACQTRVKTENGKTWDAEIMPQETKSEGAEELKVKMMDIELL